MCLVPFSCVQTHRCALYSAIGSRVATVNPDHVQFLTTECCFQDGSLAVGLLGQKVGTDVALLCQISPQKGCTNLHFSQQPTRGLFLHGQQNVLSHYVLTCVSPAGEKIHLNVVFICISLVMVHLNLIS